MGEPGHAGERGTTDDVRTGLSVEAFKRAYEDNLRYSLGRFSQVATPNDRYLALAHAVRDRLMDRWIRSGEAYYRARARTVCYLSAEYLLGPHLGNNLLKLGVLDEARRAMEELGLDFDELLDQEEEPGLGTGASGGWPPATWTLWPRSGCRPSATASVTSSGSSTRPSATAGRWR
jgi:starch phosphorylase